MSRNYACARRDINVINNVIRERGERSSQGLKCSLISSNALNSWFPVMERKRLRRQWDANMFRFKSPLFGEMNLCVWCGSDGFPFRHFSAWALKVKLRRRATIMFHHVLITCVRVLIASTSSRFHELGEGLKSETAERRKRLKARKTLFPTPPHQSRRLNLSSPRFSPSLSANGWANRAGRIKTQTQKGFLKDFKWIFSFFIYAIYSTSLH
jgi:hypothetical protein